MFVDKAEERSYLYEDAYYAAGVADEDRGPGPIRYTAAVPTGSQPSIDRRPGDRFLPNKGKKSSFSFFG